MNTESLKAEPSLMEKVELIRTMIELMKGGFGKEVYELAEEKLTKLLKEI